MRKKNDQRHFGIWLKSVKLKKKKILIIPNVIGWTFWGIENQVDRFNIEKNA